MGFKVVLGRAGAPQGIRWGSGEGRAAQNREEDPSFPRPHLQVGSGGLGLQGDLGLINRLFSDEQKPCGQPHALPCRGYQEAEGGTLRAGRGCWTAAGASHPETRGQLLGDTEEGQAGRQRVPGGGGQGTRCRR